MALPAKLKTWQLTRNLDPGYPGTDSSCVGALFIMVKDAMQAFATNAWTCVGSSDSVTAGLDAVDRLTDYTKVVRPGGTHSWIVLQQDQLGSSPSQVCFDWNSSDPEEVYVFLSPSAGFTGGSTAARPTATDEVGITEVGQDRINFVPVDHISDKGTSVRAHVMMSTDGKCTRILCCQGGVARTFFAFEEPVNPPTGWADPVIMIALGDIGAPNQPPLDPLSFYIALNWYDYIIAQGPISAMKMNFTLEALTTGGVSDGTAVGYTPWPNADETSDDGDTDHTDDEYPLNGVGIFHGAHGGASVVGQRGRHGWLADFYFTAASVTQGKNFPGDGSKSWVVFGNVALPWDGGDVEMG